VPRADLVGVCTIGDRPPIVVDVTVVLPHNPDELGEPVPAGTAANKVKSNCVTKAKTARARRGAGLEVAADAVAAVKGVGPGGSDDE